VKQIRKGCFETNSSSVHAICINKGDFNTICSYYENTEIEFDFGDFGWECDKYQTPNEKARYLWTALNDIYCTADWLDKDILTENKNELQKYKNLIKEKLNKYNISCTFVEADHEHNGYVDHATELDSWIDMLFSDDNYFYNYLFNVDSYVETGNDNAEMDYDASFTEQDADYTVYWKRN
jgi:hypothetical protein